MVGAITDDALVYWLGPIIGGGKNAVFFGQIDNLHFRSLVGLFVLKNTFHCYLIYLLICLGPKIIILSEIFNSKTRP